jgi:hypothetical protein
MLGLFGNFRGNFFGRSGGGPTNQSGFYGNQSGGGGYYDSQPKIVTATATATDHSKPHPICFYLYFRIQCMAS